MHAFFSFLRLNSKIDFIQVKFVISGQSCQQVIEFLMLMFTYLVWYFQSNQIRERYNEKSVAANKKEIKFPVFILKQNKIT